MILDKIENWKLYFTSPIFVEIFQELNNFSKDTPNGVYKSNDHYYFKVMSYDTKLEGDIIESHCKEIDVQILFSGKEHIKIYNEKSVSVKNSYNEETDCQFYNPVNPPIATIDLIPEYMAVFFPDDIHQPQLAVDGTISNLKKVVIKINEELFA